MLRHSNSLVNVFLKVPVSFQFSNYCGKSTLLKQVASIVFLAQIGSFVPASSAHLGLVDKSKLERFSKTVRSSKIEAESSQSLLFLSPSSYPCSRPRNCVKNAKLFYG